MGTSLTARYGWSARLEETLRVCLERPVQVTEIAMSGETSDWALSQVDHLAEIAPDILLIEYSINDADIRHRIGPSQSKINHILLFEAARSANADVQIALMIMNRAYGLRAFLRPRLSAYETMYLELASEENASLIDLVPPWRTKVDEEGLWSVLPDGLHPTEDAATAVIVPVVTEHLARLFGRTCSPN